MGRAPCALSERDLEAKLYGPGRVATRSRPDPVWIHTERQRKGVTLESWGLRPMKLAADAIDGADAGEPTRPYVPSGRRSKVLAREMLG